MPDDQHLSQSVAYGLKTVNYDCDAPILVKIWSDGKVPMATAPVWLEARAHRSEYSGAALAAQEFDKGDPKSSVTFLTFASSGARIDKGLIQAQHPEWQKRGGQIGDMTDALRGTNREVDALVISIGGNDIGFSSWVEKATTYNLQTYEWLRQFMDIDPNALPESQIRNSLDALSQKYDNLYVALKSSGITFRNTIMTGYPNNLFFGRDAQGKDVLGSCGWFSRKEVNVPVFDDPVIVDGISVYEARLFKNSSIELNRVLAMKVLNFMALDQGKWDMVGVADEFEGHGYCAGDQNCYYVFASSSCKMQGDLDGVLHPNAKGREVYKTKILEKLKRKLRPAVEAN